MRTDRTYVCAHCRIRTWPVRRCPACGETASLGDLEEEALAVIEARAPRRGGSLGTSMMMMIGGGAGALCAVPIFAAGAIGIAEVVIGASIVAIVAGALRAPKPAVATTPYELLGSPVVRAAAARATVTGRVRAKRTIVAPLSGEPCVAWRLVADGAPMPLDDAQSTAFTVVGPNPSEHEIDARVATIDLAVHGEPRALGTIAPELAEWLRSRGIGDATKLLVREAVLRDGAEVEIEGTTRTEAKAAGYRGHDTREVLADLPGSPLVVRSPRNTAPATIA